MSTFPSRGVPILMYHNVSPSALPTFRKYTVDPRAFARQMNWLKRSGFQAITPDDLLTARAGTSVLPPRPVLITFDDGFAECEQFAAPALRACGFSAVFYIVAGLIGGRSDWLRAERGVDLPLMNWESLRRLHGDGFVIGAHTLSHPHLPAISEAACRREIEDSRATLQSGLDAPVTHFAYPFGDHNAAVRSYVMQAGFASACSVKIGRSGTTDDEFALHRVPVSGLESMGDFVFRVWTARTMREYSAGMLARLLGRRTSATQQ